MALRLVELLHQPMMQPSAIAGSLNPSPHTQYARRITLGMMGALLLICYPLFFHHLGQRDLWSSHEGRAAQNAARLLSDGDWLLPRLFDGRIEMQKPPLYYWMTAILGWCSHGIDATVVRLPSALAACGCLLLVFWAFARKRRPWAGFVAALILATMVRFTWMARVGRIDMPLTFAVTLSLMGYWNGRDLAQLGKAKQAFAWRLFAFLGMAMGFLLKGPIGIVLPTMVIAALGFASVLLTKCTTFSCYLASVRPTWWGLPLVMALVLPWFYYAHQQTHGAFFHEFFVRHNLQRGLGGDDQLDSHEHPFWFYALHWPVDACPWSFVGIGLVIWALRTKNSLRDPLAILGCVWFLSLFLMLSCVRYKRPEYLLPAYPGLALFLGGWLEQMRPELSERAYKRWRWCIGMVVGLSMGGWLLFVDVWLPAYEPEKELKTFAGHVRALAPRPGMVLLFRVDSHALNYHLGRPTERLWEWENLDIWAVQPDPVYVIMPQSWAAVWEQYLEAGHLYPVTSTVELSGSKHEVPLYLFRTQPLR